MEEQKKETSSNDIESQTVSNLEENEGINTEQSADTVITPEATDTKQSSSTAQSSENIAKNATRNMIIGIAAALLLLGSGYYFFMQNNAQAPAPATTGSDITTTIDPDAVVARVNGTDLLGKSLIQQITQAAQVIGLPSVAAADTATQEQLKSQSLDALVNTELIGQAAKSAGIVVTPEDVDAEYTQLAESIGGEEAAQARLDALGTSVDEFKKTLVNDILIRRYLESQTDASVLDVSDEEIQAFYTQVTGGQTEGVPTLDEARLQIEQQLKFQKEQQELQSVVEELRSQANIEILI